MRHGIPLNILTQTSGHPSGRGSRNGRGGGGGGGLWTDARGQQEPSNNPGSNQHNLNTPTTGRHWRANSTPCHIQHSPGAPTTGLRERGNDNSKSTGRSGRQKAATRRNMRREERVTVQGPVKKQQPDGMSHRGLVHPKIKYPKSNSNFSVCTLSLLTWTAILGVIACVFFGVLFLFFGDIAVLIKTKTSTVAFPHSLPNISYGSH